MEGKVRVQIFDTKTKKCVKDTGFGKNIITNLYKYVMEDCVNFLKNTFSNGIPRNLLTMQPKDLSDGILLLESLQNENVDTLYPEGKLLGYAGSTYEGTDTDRGDLNETESGTITEGGVVHGYKWVWDFDTDRCNGTFRAVGLCPAAVGDNCIWNSGRIIGTYDGTSIPSSFPELDTNGVAYIQFQHGYKKRVPRSVGYLESLSISQGEIEYVLPGWAFCKEPVLYKNKIWTVAYDSNGNTGYYLLRITKDTNVVEQTWKFPSYEDAYEFTRFGLTDTHVHWVYNNSGNRIRSFNLSTLSFELTEPAISTYVSTNKWFCAPDQAALLQDSYGTGYCFIIHNDQTLRVLPTTGNAIAFLPFTERPYGIGFYRASSTFYYRHLIFLLSLFSVKNLESTITKNNTQTMKITYTLTW